MTVALILLAAAAVQPGAVKTFKDWTVGCDNGRSCQAVALMPENDYDDAATLVLTRGPAANAIPQMTIAGEPRGVVGIATDGKRIAVRLMPSSGELRVVPADAPALVAAIPNAQKIELLDRSGKAIARISPAGASAAMRYIDDQQKRVGTTTALVARGTATIVPQPPALPVVMRPPTPKTPPARYNTANIQKYAGTNECEVNAKMFSPDAFRLDAIHTLILVPTLCGNGAYNYFFTALIAGNSVGSIAVAKFDANAGMSAEESADASLVNASWDEGSRLLSTFAKGRGVGDCGTMQSFAWDGSQFRLVEQTQMDECRGSVNYIPVWRATVR